MTEEKARIVASLIEKGKGAQRELDSTKALLIEYKHLHDTLTARLENEKENSQSYKAELSKADEQITNLQKQKADLEKEVTFYKRKLRWAKWKPVITGIGGAAAGFFIGRQL
jgi:chromosome segregation ATPase